MQDGEQGPQPASFCFSGEEYSLPGNHTCQEAEKGSPEIHRTWFPPASKVSAPLSLRGAFSSCQSQMSPTCPPTPALFVLASQHSCLTFYLFMFAVCLLPQPLGVHYYTLTKIHAPHLVDKFNKQELNELMIFGHSSQAFIAIPNLNKELCF